MVDLDEITKQTSGNGRYQVLIVAFSLYAPFVSAMSLVASLFLGELHNYGFATKSKKRLQLSSTKLGF